MCWTEFLVPAPYGQGLGTIWAWPSFLENGDITDDECRANTVPPIMPLQGHSAPLGITFYEWKPTEDRPASCPANVAFPQCMDGYAFIAYHGSWNREVPTGYKVVYVEMDEFGNPIGDQPYDLLMHQPPNAQWEDGFRPVDVSFDSCGRLLVSSDGSKDDGFQGSRIVRIEYTGRTNVENIAPTSSSPTASSGSLAASPEATVPLPISPTAGPTATVCAAIKAENRIVGEKLNDSPGSLKSGGSLGGAPRPDYNVIIGVLGCLWALFG
jgi:hypothetical protein